MSNTKRPAKCPDLPFDFNRAAPYEAFQTSGGSWVLIAAAMIVCSPTLRGAGSEIPKDDLFAQRRACTAALRVHDILEGETRRYTSDELIHLLRAAGVPATRSILSTKCMLTNR